MLHIKDKIGDAPKLPVEEIKKYADAVTIPRASILKITDFFIVGNEYLYVMFKFLINLTL